MKARILPREEWSRLSITGIAPIQETLRPEDVQVIVVEDGDRIVASMGAFRVTHFESLWIAPEYRGNAGLGRRLLKAGITAATKWATDWVWAASGTNHMDDVLTRMGGAEMPVKTFVLQIK